MDYIQQTTKGDHGSHGGHCQLKLVDYEADENHISHETQGLSQKHLVVRRGKPFKITLKFGGQSWDPNWHRLILDVKIGDLFERMRVQLPEEWPNPHRWSAIIDRHGMHPHSVTINICSPVMSAVGLYDLYLHIETRHGRKSFVVGAFILLCNPWHSDDPVYMPNDAEIEEYMKSDYGWLFMGTALHNSSRPWSFGQYEPGVLEACLQLLQISPQHLRDKNEDYSLRADPVYLSRVLCAMVNSADDDRGILLGKWQGSYADGVKPTDWSGSADILNQWISSEYKPVRYGQCWVFASVLCTVMRALGIPSRVVTVFNAAHDGDCSLSVEEYYSTTGEKLNLSRDSVWNFHVWVESWMRRLDLSPEFNGWQVVDPTPQEKSAGIYRCGPCPVAAVKQRVLRTPFDTPFLHAAVNADIIRLIVRDGQVVGRKVDSETVGQLIYTKSVGSDRPEDLTPAYKDIKDENNFFGCSISTSHGGGGGPGDMMMRSCQSGGGGPGDMMMWSCQSGGGGPGDMMMRSCQSGGPSAPEDSSSLEVSLNIEGVPSVGDGITLTVTITSHFYAPRVLIEHVNAQLKEFNSGPQQSFWKTSKKVHMETGGDLKLSHVIPPSTYEACLAGDDIVNVAVVITDEESDEKALAAQEFSLSSPQITIEIEGGDTIKQKEKQTAKVSFVNTFSKPLNGAVLTVEGSGLLQGKQEARLALLKPGEKIEKQVSIEASSPGTKVLMATFSHSDCPSVVSRCYHKVSVKN
ncbi:protein-glutamine gamma-glutamyltransferase 2-like isoform X2 [Cheilinus undulatus]|nr:protein-glutamine gamma-glutamyltransferase 2-like isoform X2 [Cheilinus undulatus]XP_041654422.1 protein-glutamine gamma-glutamyltransferase 2-like isoform X2 [Cheilinus undulatus]